jgi:hypothetical protein
MTSPPPHDHGTTLRRGPFEDLGVDRVLFRHPRVELRCVAEPVLFVGAGPGHVPVQRHGDIGNHLRHFGLLSATISSADHVPSAESSRRSKHLGCAESCGHVDGPSGDVVGSST